MLKNYKQRKAKRQEARQALKLTKATRRQDRRDKRVELKQERRTGRMNRKQDRKDVKMQGSLYREEETPQSPVLAKEQAIQETEGATTLNPLQATKAVRFLTKRGRTPQKDHATLATQVIEEREKQVKERNEEDNRQLKGLFADAAPEDMPEEEEFPDLEDTEEDIMIEEEEEFGFNQSEEDYLDPATVGVIYNVAKSGADKVRERQFAQGKKWMGMTQKQWEAKQAEKKAIEEGKKVDPSVINAMIKTADDDITRQTIRDYMPFIIGGSILIIAGIAYAYYKGRKG